MREVPPRSLSSLYEPDVFETFHDEPWDDPTFRENLGAGDIESFFQWWVSRLNVFYSHAADPTRFVDDAGNHEAATQRAWFLTFERMIADATLVLAAERSEQWPRSGRISCTKTPPRRWISCRA